MKWLFGLIAAVIVLIVAAIVIIPMVVDPNDYKEEIVTAVKSATGRDLSIRDDMELSVFPSLALRLGGVGLSNAAGFDAKQMAAIEELDLKVAVMPLLSGSLEVDTVVVRGLELNLAKDKNGKTNWDDLTGEKKTAPAEEGDSTETPDLALHIQGIVIDGAKLVWDDQQSGKHYQLDNLNLKTGAIASGKSVPLELGLVFKSASPEQTLEFDLTTTVTANGDFTRIQLADLVAQLAAAGDGLPAAGLDLEVKTNLDLDQAAGTVAISDLTLTGPDVELTGALNGKGLNGTPSFDGSFKLSESNLKQLMALGGTPPVTADPAALTRVSAEFGVQASDTSAALKPFTVKLDDSTFTGDFSVKSFDGPALRFALNLDQIDVDRYLPPAAEGEAAAGEAAPAAAARPGDDPLAALRTLDLGGKIKIGQVKILKLNTANIEVGIESKAGVLAVNPIAADLYEGKVAGDIRIDAREKTPTITVKNALSGIQISPLLADFSDTDKLSGKGTVNVDLKMRGLDAAQIKKSLNGQIGVEFKDGAYKGVDVIKTICSIGTNLDSLLKGATGTLEQSGETEFSAMSATVVVTNGIAENNDLDVKSPLLRVTGKGSANLPEDTVDYLVDAELVKACEGQSGASAEKLVGVPLPIRAKGPMSGPSISPDWAALGQKLAGSKVKEQAEGLIKDKLKIPGVGGTAGEGATGDPAKGIGGAVSEGLKKLF